MPVDVKIPQLGESITEAEIVRWLKANGDPVEVDEPIAEIETDKATAELPAPAAGVLEIVAAEGSTVKPGDVVARIREGKGDAKQPKSTPPARDPVRDVEPRTVKEAKEPATAAPAPPRRAAQGSPRADGDSGRRSAPRRNAAPSRGSDEPVEAAADSSGAVELSPAVRRLVEENHLDPSRIDGTGPGGRLTKEDVLAHIHSQAPAERPNEAAGRTNDEAAREIRDTATAGDKSAHLSLVRGPANASQPASPEAPSRPAPATPAPAPARREGGPDEERVRMSRLRRSIAQRLVEAQHTAAILTTFNEIDMSNVMDLRSRFKDKFAQTHGVSLGFMSFFGRACVLALRDVPVVNSRIEGEEVVTSHRVHLGIAASTERGLVVPVVRNADVMNIAELEREIGRLAELARNGRIGLDDLSGGTFTISNGGVFGSLMSTPILNPPQSGILGMHKIEKRPVVVNDQIVIRPMMYVALSYDHRLVDGREAVTFLVKVKERIEDPERLLLEV